MKLTTSLELMKQYQQCPECGNDKIGSESGSLVIDGNRFERSCKCGWKVIIELPGGTEE